MLRAVTQFGPVVAAVVMLALLAGVARLEIVTVGVKDYMARSKAAIEALPTKVGGFEGEKRTIDIQARDLLKPNAESVYVYKGFMGYSKIEALYSVIQTDDARFMTGHAPMNCYPGSGYDTVKQEPRIWRVGEFDVNGIEYVFRLRNRDGADKVCNVRNFFIFPDGHFGASLGELDAAAQNYRTVKYGVTQVQLVTAAGLSDQQRDQLFSTLVGSKESLEMIRVLRTGLPK